MWTAAPGNNTEELTGVLQYNYSKKTHQMPKTAPPAEFFFWPVGQIYYKSTIWATFSKFARTVAL